MIGKLDPGKHRKWPLHIGSVLIAYNATRSPSYQILAVLPDVQETAPVASRPAFPNKEHQRMDPYH